MTTVAPATNAPAGAPTTSQIQGVSGDQLDDIPPFLQRKPGDPVPQPPVKTLAKIPYAGKERPTETKALRAPKNIAVALPVDGGSATALRKILKDAAAPKAAIKVAKPAKAIAIAKERRGKTKLEVIAALLQRKNGTTNAEILEASGWPSVSVPQQAKAAGLKLRKEKVKGKPTRYFGLKVAS